MSTCPKSLVLVVPDPHGPVPEQDVLGRSGLAGRLGELGDHVFAFESEGPFGLSVLPDAKALTEKLAETGCDAIILVEPTQLFLDTALALEGLAQFDPAFHDTFTQWEHCRLPVGVGVRAIASRAWLALDAESPDAALAKIRANPAGRKFAYDASHRVSFEESLLDARLRPGLKKLPLEEVKSWNLAGFLALATDQFEALAYSPPGDSPRVDERRMPAAYGFESAECASFPTYVMFDVTNLCNARCLHCPQSLVTAKGEVPEFLREKEHQTLDTFRQVIDECRGHQVNFVRITADGEPLVHPHIFEMLEYAHSQGVGPVGLTTNGSLLRGGRAERLIVSGVGMVDFSLDAARKETFEKIRVGLSYDRTLENIHRFLELRKSHKVDVRVVVSFVKQEANKDEVDEFRALWEPLVDEVVVREMISNVGLNDPSENDWPGWDARWPCAHFFRRVVINHRGILKACPIDWEQRTVNEPVKTASLHSQWHSDFYWSHRMQHLNDRIEESSACHKCPDWSGTPWDLGYEKIIERLIPTIDSPAA